MKSFFIVGIYICYYLFKLFGFKVFENCIGFFFVDEEKIVIVYYYSDLFVKFSYRYSWDNEVFLFNSLLEYEEVIFILKEFEFSLE